MKKPRARNLILILLAGLCLLAAEGYLILRAGLLNDRLVALGLDAARRALVGRIEVGAVEGDPFSGLVIRDFRLTGEDGQLIAAASEAMADFDLLRLFRLRAPARVRIEHAYFHAEKRDGRWNLHRLRRPRPARPKKPRRSYPPLMVEAEVSDLRLIISPSVDRVYDSDVHRLGGRLATRGRDILFSISDFSGRLRQPALGINGLTGEGRARGADRGWDLNFENCLAVTASSVISLKTGFYQTGESTVAAEFDRLEIAPDVLSVFWPSHTLAIPVKGNGKVSGSTARPEFSARISSSAGDLNAVGFYDRAQNLVELKGDLFDFSLTEFLVKPVPLENMTGGFALAYQRPAPGEPPDPNRGWSRRHLLVHLQLLDFSYPGVNSFPGIAEIELADDAWTLVVLSEFPGTNFTASITASALEPRPLTVRAVLREVNPRRLRPGWPEGRLAGVLKIDGQGTSLQTFRGRAEAELDPGVLYGFTIAAADLHAAVAAGRINFVNSAVAAEGLAVRGGGFVNLVSPQAPFNFDLDAQARNPRLISRLTKGAVDAPGAAARLNLSGTRSSWSVKGSGSADAIKTAKAETAAATARLDLVSRSGRIEGRVDLSAERVTIPGATFKSITVPPLAVALTAEIPSSPLRRPVINFNLNADSESHDYAMNGSGRLEAGKSSDWRLDLAALALRVAGRDWSLARPALVAQDRDGILLQEIKIVSGRERLAADGRVRRGDLNLSLAAEQLDLEPWARVLQFGDTVAGVMDLAVTLSGAPDRPHLDAALTVDKPVYRGASLDRISGGLNYEAGRFNLDITGGSAATGEIKTTGFLPMRLSLMPGAFAVPRTEPLEVKIKAEEVDADVIAVILPSLTDITGKLKVDVRLAGSIQSPSWNGKVKLRETSFSMPSWGLRMEKVSGKAEITDNLVSIEKFAGHSGRGKAGLSGTLRLAAFSVTSLDLIVTANNFRAMNTPEIGAELDGRLTLQGTPRFPKIAGDLEFTELSYRPPPLLQYQGTNWEKEDPTIRVKGEELGEPGQSPWLDRGDLNINVVIPTNTGLIRSSELNLPFGGELALRKPPGGFFLIFGRIEAREGWLMFQGRPFRVERGNFVFPAIPAIDPDIDILASYRAGAYNTFLKLGGTLSAPTLEMYSEPPLEQADVLSVILFGRPVSELAAGQRESLALTGGQLAASYAAAGLSRSLSDALKLDALVFSPGESFETSGFGVGKYLNERLYVFYYHQFGEEAADEFRLRYDVYKNIYVEAGQDRTGQGGADVFFSYPY